MIQGFGLPAYSGLHYEGSMELMGQIHAQRRERHENEMMKRAASGELSDRRALPIYGAVLALIGLDANRRISAETAVQACQWSAPPEKPEGCGVPAYSVAADIEERRRKSGRAEAIETAVLVEFARLAADPDDWLPYRVRQTLNLYELACLLHRQDPERFAKAIHHEQVSHDRANGISIDAGTAHRVAERVNLSPEQMLGDAVGGTLKTLKKATGASTFQRPVSIDEARRVTAALRIEWPPELDSAGAPTLPAPSASAPAVADRESVAPPAEAVPVQQWTVKKPEKFQGYGHPLHELLKRAHAAGNARPPTAQDVLDAWSSSKPYGITRVMPDGFEYLDGTGATKEANRDAIRKAIGRMVNRTTSGR